MTNPQYKLGSLTHSLYRDLLTDETIIKNNNIDVLKISGTTNEDALLVSTEDPVIRVLSTNTGTTSSASLTMGINGGDVWDISTGISGGTVNTNLDLFINKNGTNKLTILDDGNVGVGTTNPSQKLDVVGDINSSGVYRLNGTQVLSNTTLGSAVVNSSLTNVGTLSSLNISGNLTVDTNVLYVNSSNNRVGINRTPSYELDVNGNARIGSSGEEAKIGYTGYDGWAGFSAINFASAGNYCLMQNNSSGAVILNRPSGQWMYFRRNNSDDMLINSSGYIGMGVGSPLTRLHIKAPANDTGGSLSNYNQACIVMEGSASSNKWGLSINNTSDELIFSYNLLNRGYLRNEADVSFIDFTGQHRNRFSENNDTYLTNIENYVGMIVCSTGSYCSNLVINEALPYIKLSTTQNDKTCYGVISDGEDINEDTRRYEVGVFGSIIQKEEGDNRVIINSVGEGGIWVCDENGPLENGDYITTSNNEGYGMKQLLNKDFLMNYTVAKITQDEDFSDMTNGRVLSNGVKCKFVGCTYHCG